MTVLFMQGLLCAYVFLPSWAEGEQSFAAWLLRVPSSGCFSTFLMSSPCTPPSSGFVTPAPPTSGKRRSLCLAVHSFASIYRHPSIFFSSVFQLQLG